MGKPVRAPSPWWAASTGFALLAGAAWLREPTVPYLVAGVAATALTVGHTLGARRAAARLAALALVGFCVLAAVGQAALARIERAWPAESAAITRRSTAVMQSELSKLARDLSADASRALDAPASPERAFPWLEAQRRGPGDRSVVLYRAGQPVAWAGRVVAATDSSSAALTVVRSPFYVTLQATARHGADRAVATAVLHGDPPADRLAQPLDNEVAGRTGVDSFAFVADHGTDHGADQGADPGAASSGDPVATLAPDGIPLVTLRAVPPRSDEARLRETEGTTSRGALLLALAIVGFVAAEWRPRATIWWRRVVALAVPMMALAIVPLNAFSNASVLFDPTYFFSPVGGPYTASVGALGVSGGIALLAGLAAARARFRLRPTWLAVCVALIASIGAPLALVNVAGGITPPGAATPLIVWVGWEIALALGTTAILVGAVVAARSALGPGGGLPPGLAIGLAVIAAILGPMLWTATEGWPAWYWALWCAAAAAAAFGRRARWGVIPAALVAALASSVVVWGTTAAKRVILAERDLAGLAIPDPEAVTLLERLGAEIAAHPTPASRAELLQLFARSDLAAATNPVRLSIWRRRGRESASLALARFDIDTVAVAAVVRAARARDSTMLTAVAGFLGVQLVLAVPGEDGEVTTAVVAPQTRLITENAFAVLVGLAPDVTAPPPYVISPLELVPRRLEGPGAAGDSLDQDDPSPADQGDRDGRGASRGASPRSGPAPAAPLRGDSARAPPESARGRAQAPPIGAAPSATGQTGLAPVRWRRIGSDLHGDWLVPSRLGPARAHVEIALRPLDALAQRAVLLVVVDLLAVMVLWWISAAGDGVVSRWSRSHARRWARSYRTQLTVVLFTFFVVPAVLFAAWSYRRLRSDDSEERALLVWQTLRAAATGGLDQLPADADRVGTPLLLYEHGQLRAASDSLFDQLAPLGRFLRADVELELGLGNEVRASRTQPLGGTPVLFGYRAVDAPGGQRVVLAAPARNDEIDLESRRSDLSILVLFSTVLGAGAALWLSGLAARQLAQPIEALRRAAIAMAAGEREPDLAGNPPAEFAPVFAAFRRMAADFGESQRVLAWGEMARQVAHEIKNPLTPIRLGIQHLQRARAARRPDFDRILDQNAGRILAEINRLDQIARSFSRYGSGPAERGPAEPVDLSPVVRDVVELERLGAGGGVEWELSGVEAPVVVLARSDEVREVLLNVLENARLAHARRVSVRVSINRGVADRGSAGAAREGAGRAAILIEDNGDGIPADVLPRIFEPHFSTRTSGSGLGLAVSRRIVESWSGAIAVQSDPGRGTRVTIALLLVGT